MRLAAQLGQAVMCWQGLNRTFKVIILGKVKNTTFILGKGGKKDVGLKTTSASDSLHSWHFPNTVASSTYLMHIVSKFVSWVVKNQRQLPRSGQVASILSYLIVPDGIQWYLMVFNDI